MLNMERFISAFADDVVGKHMRNLSTVVVKLQAVVADLKSKGQGIRDLALSITSAAASDQGTSETLANEIKTDFNLHVAKTTMHLAAAPTGEQITVADASDLTTLQALANEIKARLNTHWLSTARHAVADTEVAITSAAATNLATSQTLLNEAKADLNFHFTNTTAHQDQTAIGLLSDESTPALTELNP